MGIVENIDMTLPLQVVDTAAFEGISTEGKTGVALQVMDSPAGPRLFVIVATPHAIVAAALDGDDADHFAKSLASARLHLAAGDTGGRRN